MAKNKRISKVKALAQKVKATAKKVGYGSPALLAVKALKANQKRKNQLKKYIERQGEQPMENVEEQVTQAHLLRNGEIEQRAEQKMEEHERNNDIDNPSEYTPDPEDIEEEIMLEEEENFAFNGEQDPDNFIDPMTLGLIKTAGQKGVETLNKARAKKGKPPIFSKKPKGGKDTGAKSDAQDIADALKSASSSAVDEVTKIKKKEEIKKMMPIIVLIGLALVVLTATTIYYARKK